MELVEVEEEMGVDQNGAHYRYLLTPQADFDSIYSQAILQKELYPSGPQVDQVEETEVTGKH